MSDNSNIGFMHRAASEGKEGKRSEKSHPTHTVIL